MGSWIQNTIHPLFIPPTQAFELELITNFPVAEQVIYSPYHNSIFVRAPNFIYRFNISNEEKTIVYGTNTYEIKYIDISDNGELIILLTSDNENSIKVMDKNLFNIKQELTTIRSVPVIAKFVSSESAIVILRDNRLNLLKFVKINYLENKFYQNGIGTNGTVINFMKVNSDLLLAVTDNGEIYSVVPSNIRESYIAENIVEMSSSSSSIENSSSVTISTSSQSAYSTSSSSIEAYFTGVKLAYSLNKSIVTADLAGIKKQILVGATQSKIRVFVGSRKWSNDMWDSGEIETNKQAIAYGGGNNLVAGQKYYSHILLYYNGIGWTSPQIQEFVVPKY